MRAVIIEDEKNSREILRGYLQKYCPSVKLEGEAANIADGKKLIQDKKPQLVFLDVEMPFGNAFDLLDELPDGGFETIFVTAYDQYAKDALNAHAAYYLTKPISIEELIKAVAYVGELIEKQEVLSGTVLQASLPRANRKITLPQQQGFLVLDIDKILYCQADDNYTKIFTAEGSHLVSKTLKYFQNNLEEYAFARIHKSYLVNINEVTEYHRGKGGNISLSNGVVLPVAAARKKQLLEYFE